MLNLLPDNAKSIVEKMIENYKADVVRNKLDEMGDKWKQMLLLYEDGCTDADIAEQTGYQNALVAKTSRLRCLQKLKQKVRACQKTVPFGWLKQFGCKRRARSTAYLFIGQIWSYWVVMSPSY